MNGNYCRSFVFFFNSNGKIPVDKMFDFPETKHHRNWLNPHCGVATFQEGLFTNMPRRTQMFSLIDFLFASHSQTSYFTEREPYKSDEAERQTKLSFL